MIDQEEMALLIYWHNRLIFCSVSYGITKKHHHIAEAIAECRTLALAPVILFHLYMGLFESIFLGFKSVRWAFWLLQYWLYAYFLEMSLVKF